MTGQRDTIETRILGTTSGDLDQAARLILSGEPVVIPTETVYGLAADATNSSAVAKIYAAKGRPAFNPLIAHVSDAEMASRYVELSQAALDLMNRFWPGPLTIVLPLKPDAAISSLVTAGLSTLAVRCPDHPVPQALIKALERPLAAPSANASGRISPTRASHVMKSLGGRVELVIDDGPTRAGLESTIVEVAGDRLRLLREGAIPAEQLGLSAKAVEIGEAAPSAPGQLESHYAPRQPVRLRAASADPDEYFIGFGGISGDLNLSASGDLIQAASQLFDALHTAEESGKPRIAIAPIPDNGLGRAINDRLRRAAAERPPMPS
jgi:L-threonylcarbamoyladenylate synthase